MIIGGAFGPRKAFKVENMIQRSGFAEEWVCIAGIP
jgi:hypothetical protein